MEKQHYKALSQWLERLGLIVVASLVIQKIVAGASLGDPIVLLGVLLTVVIYATALHLLLRTYIHLYSMDSLIIIYLGIFVVVLMLWATALLAGKHRTK